MTPYTCDLRDADNLQLVGGKGANLGRLLRLGFPVPPGFVVTTAAYRAVLAPGELSEGDPEQLRARLRAIALPAEVRGPIVAEYRQLGAGAVAVRSSGTAEDLAAASFAGQHETFLDVTGEDALLAAVRACWASLWSPRAVAYRRQHGWDDTNLALAVVVQAMVPAEWAGVLFTADPVTGRRDRVVIEAVQGLGEALVSGEATGQRAVVEKRRLRLLSGGGAVPERLPGELAQLGARIEAAFGQPQDIEWAVAAGRIAILQARPLTALPEESGDVAPAATRRYSRLQREGALHALDHMPLPPYPFDVALYYRPLLGRALQALRSLGLVPAPLGDVLVEVAEGVVQMVPPTIRPTLRALTLPAKLVRALRSDPEAWLAECRATLVARAEQIDAEELTGRSDAAILDRIEELQRLQLGLFMGRFGHLVPGLLLGQALPALLRLAVGRRAAPRLHADLVAAVPCTTTAANRALGHLARHIRATEDVRAVFLAAEPGQIPARLATVAGGNAALAEVADFLRRYGYRELAMAGAAFPAWRDDPVVVYGLLKGLVSGEQARSALDGDDPGRAARAREEVRGALSRRWIGRLFLRPPVLAAIDATRRSIAYREDSHFLLFLPFTVMHRLALELGRRFVARGALADARDIFFLGVAELRQPGQEEQVRETVRRRQVARRSVEGSYTAVPAALLEQATVEGAIVGVPASPGRVVGQVRVILHERDFWQLRSGEVLVAPYTNPSWTPLFAVAGAVVVDAGGAASHAAIVAREYGIPAVMGTRNGTRVLRDGQPVLVDGTAGRVVPTGAGASSVGPGVDHANGGPTD